MEYRDIVQNIIDNKNNELKNQYFNELLAYFRLNNIDVYEQIGCMNYLLHTKRIMPDNVDNLSEWDNFEVRGAPLLFNNDGLGDMSTLMLGNLRKDFQMKFENSFNV